MSEAETAILGRRRLSNRLIAARDAARLRPFFTSDIHLIVGDGGLLLGVEAVIAAFAAQFADPEFVAYERTPARVTATEDGERAAEAGDWIGRWRDGREMAGTYLAAWRKVRGQWLIERELYVTLRG